MSTHTVETNARAIPLFSRDFSEIEGGESFATAGRTVTESDVVAFATLTGDFHPQHVDADWARRSAFGQRVAHGMLVLSYAVGLVPLDPERVVALRRIDDAVLKRPVLIGDTISVEGRVDGVTPVDATIGLVATTWRIFNQDRKLVARTSVEVLWRRGDGAPDASPSVDECLVLPL